MGKIYYKVAGTDVSEYVTYKTVDILDVLNSEPNTLEFVLHEPDSVPDIGQEIIIYNGIESNKIFAGIIIEVDEKSFYNEERFDYAVCCSDYQEILIRRLAAVSYENQTCGYIINDLITTYFSEHNFTLVNVSAGITISRISFNYKPVIDCIGELAYLSGYRWYVDYDKGIHFCEEETKAAPFNIIKGELRYRNLTMTPSLTQVKNRIIVRGGTYLSPDTKETFIGDGSTEWALNYKPHNIRVYEDDVQNESIGIDNLTDPDTVDFLINYQDKTLIVGTGHTVAAGVSLDIIYNYDINVITRVDDSSSQTDIAGIEGGDGIHEFVIFDKEIDSLDSARDMGEAELDKSRAIEVGGSFETYEDGWKTGQSFTINLSNRKRSGNYTVQRIIISQYTSNVILYKIEFSVVSVTLPEIIAELLKDRQKAVLDNIETIDKVEIVTDDVDITDTVTATLQAHPVLWGPTFPQPIWNEFTWG